MRARTWVVAIAGIGCGIAALGLGRREGPSGESGTPVVDAAPMGEPGLTGRVATAPRAEPPKGQPAEARKLASRIEGVVQRDGKPAAARVELRRRPSTDPPPVLGAGAIEIWRALRAAPIEVAEAAEDGRFAFVGVATDDYVVQAEAIDGATGRVPARIPVHGARASLVVALQPSTAVLHGRVLTADGAPWSGTVMVLDASEWEGVPSDGLGITEADSEGKFTVTRLPETWIVAVAVSAQGGATAGPPVRLPSSEEYRLVWGFGRAPVEGRVLAAADRTPIPGAEVVGATWSSVLSKDMVRTGEDGRFRVLVARDRWASVHVRAAGHASASVPLSGRTGEIEVLLSREARIRGRVLRRGDEGAIVGAVVRVLPDDERDSQRADVMAETDSEGRFAVEGLAAGAYSLYAQGAGYVSAAFLSGEGAARNAGRIELKAGDDVEVTLQVIRGARILGTVSDSNGGRVPGAIVIASRRIGGRSHDPDPPPWEAYGFERVATGQDGGFDVTSLVPGVEYELTARAPDLPKSPRLRATASVEPSAPVELVLPKPRWIEVTVLDDSTGKPVTGARLSGYAEPEDDGDEPTRFLSVSEAPALTNEAGRARVGPLGPGAVSVSVRAEGYVDDDLLIPLDVIEGPTGLTGTVRVRRGGRISGRVLGADGSAVGGATVELRTATGPGSWRGTSVETRDTGEFTFGNVAGGEHTLRATVESEGLVSEDVPAAVGAADVTLRVLPRSLRVRVLDSDGNPVPSARASYCAEHTCYNGKVEGGRVVILDDDAVEAEEGRLEVTDAADANGKPLPLGPARVEGVRPGRELVVRLPRERTIEGRVVAPDGRGLPGIRVRAEALSDEITDQVPRMESPWIWGVSTFVRTDDAGTFRIGRLGDGPHYVAALPSIAHAVPPVQRRDAGSSGVEFRLRTSVSAVVTVLGPDARPVLGATVVALHRMGQSWARYSLFTDYRNGWSTESATDANGRVRLEGLDPEATYWLGARAPSGAALADQVERVWRPRNTTLRLATGLTVAGIAKDASGNALAGVHVDCTESNGGSRSSVTRKDGTFRFEGLGAGPVRLEARLYDHALGRETKTLYGGAIVEAGAEGVDLRLR